MQLTADNLWFDGDIKNVEAAKLSRVGDFNYMVYTKRTKQIIPKNVNSRNSPIEATLSIYSPHHKDPVY